MANKVEIELSVEQQQAIKAINDVISATDRLGKESKKNFDKTDAAVSSFKGNLAALAASKAFGVIANNIGDIVSASAKLEVYETQFKTMLGSTIAAQEQLKELQAFAANTPFQLDGLANSTRQLLSFGVAQREIIPTLKTLGDVASGVGADISELTIPYGRLLSAQKLNLVELEKFSDRGVNIYAELSKQTGISMGEIRDAVSKGKVPFSEFETALKNLTSEGGLFFGSMEAQSKTLSGATSTLDDNFKNLQGAIGDALKPALIDSANTMTEIFKAMTTAFSENGPAMASVMKTIAEVLIVTPSKFFLDLMGGESKANIEDAAVSLAKVKKEFDDLVKLGNDDPDRAALMFVNEENFENEKVRLLEQIQELNSIVDQNTEERKAKDAADEKAIAATEAKKIEIKKAELKKQKKETDAFRKAEDDFNKIMKKQALKEEADFWSASTSLASSGNKALAAIGKASALTQLAIKTPEAVGNSFAFGTRTGGPILGAILGSIAATAMAAQAAKIAGIGGFATGGVVGGFTGASLGGDNTLTPMREGEMVLTASDQKTLFTDIRSGNLGGGNSEAVMAALAQPIIIEIDGKEIARANRNAVREGFVAA